MISFDLSCPFFLLSTRYQTTTTKTQKKEFQETFMEEEMSTIVQKHSHTERHVESEYVGGEHESFDRLVWLQGGSQNPANVQASIEICRECIKRGGRYYTYDDFSKRYRYANPKSGFNAKYSNSWEKTTTGTVAEKATGAPPAKAAGGPPEADKPGKKPGQPKQKTALDIAFQKAMQTKVAYSNAENKARDIMASWKAGENAKEKRGYEEELKNALKSLRAAKSSDAFFSPFILRDASDIKASYAEADMTTLCNRFADALALPIDEVDEINKQILDVIRARLKPTSSKRTKK